MNPANEVVVVNDVFGLFQANQRIVAQDVFGGLALLKPHHGTVVSVWSDGTATINWDTDDAERDAHFVVNGRVDLNHLRRIHEKKVVAVEELNGITVNQRVVVQDVQASPVHYYNGRVTSLWSDGKARIVWDFDNHERDRHLVESGHVDLHHVRPLNS